MCTAISFSTKDHYFGRNLDLEYSYEEQVVVTPRNFELKFRKKPPVKKHYAMIGMAIVREGYPLYYDAVNEWGLAMAGLNFPGNACYFSEAEEKDNITPFELIPWILARCKNVEEASQCLENINLCKLPFSRELPLSPLHWMIADKSRSLTAESVKEGLKIYDNPVGVLTNNPPFEYHLMNLNNYLNVTAKEPENRFGEKNLQVYSRGMGGIGLPGDFSSASRFVKAAFVKINSQSGTGEEESVSQFFHILGSVAHPRGSVRFRDGNSEITIYSCCMNLEKGIYYYTTYENSGLSAVDIHACDPEGDTLSIFSLKKEPVIYQHS